MPTLPSGRMVGLRADHILEPGTQWFECPEGHFWYQTPDLALNAPPFHPEQQVICDFVHAPCPTTVEETERFVEVVGLYGEGRSFLLGFTLDRAERPDGWSDEDCAAWNAWRRTPEVRAFLERTRARCRAQADANIGRGGPVSFTEAPDFRPAEVQERERAARARSVECVRELVRLEGEVQAARAEDDTARAQRLFDRLVAIQQELVALLDDNAESIAEGWHALGIVSRLLRFPADAERAFMQAARLVPFEPSPWIELTRIRAETGDLAGAETAARRAVELAPDMAPAWANLAAVLMQTDRFEESRVAADRALAIDPDDRVAVQVDRFLRGR
jgi:tetratricopeptide (TPR) repeat protein